METTPSGDRVPVSIEQEMRSSYLDYAMSVIIGRALPDVRDGLKPVHRRALFAMHEQRNTFSQAYKKSARIVGDVIGKYHPHGDSAVYDTIVRMAQEFSMRYVLVDGQGNFGSVDGDPPAAMRYTEIRMTRLTGELLADLEKDTVDYQPNYDGSTSEPKVLPAKFPNLLVNGSSGIAVGMSTNIPPHNLREVIDATVALIRDPNLTIDDLMGYVQGPDFPTAGYIYGRKGIHEAYHKGRGVIQLRAQVDVETSNDGQEKIIVTELPYQVNKARLLERMAQLVRDKRLEGIRHLQDESDRKGMRISIELKRDAMPQVVINQLFKLTPMQTSFGIINLAIVHGRPQVLDLKSMLRAFVDHRRDVVTRRCLYELRQAEARAHILEGYRIALENIDEIVELIKTSGTPAEAKERLQARFTLSPIQAQAILDLRLQRLTGMERDKILEELKEVRAEIDRLKSILADENLLLGLIIDELEDVKDRFADERRTRIIDQTIDITLEDLIAPEDMVVLLTHEGYIKRMSVNSYRTQKRGGKGRRGAVPKEEDVIIDVFVANTHTDLLVFTDKGRVFQIKVYELPEGSHNSRGKPIVNMVSVEKDENVRAVLPIVEWQDDAFLVFATRQGLVKKTLLTAYSNVLSRGIIAINLVEGDDLVSVHKVMPEQHIVLASENGQSIRFPETDLRAMGRGTRGVRGISLSKNDIVIGMEVVKEGSTLLSVSEQGYGKRTETDEYRLQSRGGKGIITLRGGDRNGSLVAVKSVTDDDDLLIVTNRAQLIRCPIREIRVVGRNTMGVRLINLASDEVVVAAERVPSPDDDEDDGVITEAGADGVTEDGTEAPTEAAATEETSDTESDTDGNDTE